MTRFMEDMSFEDRKQAALSQVLDKTSDSPLPIERTIPGFVEEALDDWMIAGDPDDRKRLADAVGKHISVSLAPRYQPEPIILLY